MSQIRRTFLKTTLLSAGAAALPLSGAVERAAVDHLPPVIPKEKSGLAVLSQKTGLTVKSVETFTRGELTLVKVRCDDGTEGWGQAAPYDADITAQILHRKVARYALGRDPADLDLIADRCIEGNYKFPWSYVCRALAGLETALWDILGKKNGKPVCALLGGRPRPLPVYGSSMSRTIQPKDEAGRLRRLRDLKGFGAFKIRVGKVNGHDEDEWPGRTEALIPEVRKGVGKDVRLLADGNSGFRPPRAIEVGRMLEEFGYRHFEEPCPYWELEWTAQVAEALSIDVAGGEQDNDLAHWRRMIRMRAVDIVQPDICYIGGLLRSIRVAEMARDAAMTCVPHSANVSLVTVFTLHLMGAISNAGPHVEFSIEETPWEGRLYEPALEVNEGRVAIPDAPGWGVEISRDWISGAHRQISES